MPQLSFHDWFVFSWTTQNYWMKSLKMFEFFLRKQVYIHHIRLLMTSWTLLPTLSSITVFLRQLSKKLNEALTRHFFQKKVVEDSRSIASENSCTGTTFCRQLPENSLLPSAVKFVTWNNKAAIFSNKGCLASKTVVQQLPNLNIPLNIAVDT